MQKKIQKKRLDSNSIFGFLSSGNVSRKLYNRAFESIGPNNTKMKGTLQQIIDKYISYAREETGSGSDPVLREQYLQYADHYQRQLYHLRDLLHDNETEAVDKNQYNGLEESLNDNKMESKDIASKDNNVEKSKSEDKSQDTMLFSKEESSVKKIPEKKKHVHYSKKNDKPRTSPSSSKSTSSNSTASNAKDTVIL